MLLKLNSDCMTDFMARMDVHDLSRPIFDSKSEIIPFKLFNVRTPAANIIKQEMLAAGGDAAVPAGCIVCAEKYVDIILFGTRKQYRKLLSKLAMMPYFGIEKIKAELSKALQPVKPQTVLADGRVLTYEQLCVMGILNITPDSFYAGSRISGLQEVVEKAGRMLSEGAGILDIGGESTRPGSDSVDGEEERKRIIPVIEAVKKAYPQAVISVDTYRAETAKAAIAVGADIINDVSAMEADKDMLQTIKENNVPVILMHMRGTPKNMQQNCIYDNVVEEIAAYLYERAQLLHDAGVGADKIILDPGIGFAKNVEQNLLLMRDLSVLTSFGYPVLLAASRKSSIGAVLGNLSAEERLEGTIATSCQAVYAGAQMIRVHDVQANVRAVRMLEAIKCPVRI